MFSVYAQLKDSACCISTNINYLPLVVASLKWHKANANRSNQLLDLDYERMETSRRGACVDDRFNQQCNNALGHGISTRIRHINEVYRV
jgi:hypothetical protein